LFHKVGCNYSVGCTNGLTLCKGRRDESQKENQEKEWEFSSERYMHNKFYNKFLERKFKGKKILLLQINPAKKPLGKNKLYG